MNAEKDPPPRVADAGGASREFLIRANTSMQGWRPRTLKHGDSFSVCDPSGDMLAGPGSVEGFYHRDTRYLSQLRLTINGARPILLSSTLRDDNAALTCDLTNPDFYAANGELRLAHDLIHIRRTRFLWQAGCFERITVRNFDGAPRRVDLEVGYAADFAPLFEVRGTRRARHGRLLSPELGHDRVKLAYTGLDDVSRASVLQFDPAPDQLEAEQARFALELAPGQVRVVYVRIVCSEPAETGTPLPKAWFGALRRARRALRATVSQAAAVASSNEIFNDVLRRSVSDLYTLVTDTPEGLYPYAGVPWFSTVFGRDGLITALETLWLDPRLARGVLLHLAAHQATAVDPATEAEPGKILHEARQGEMARLGEVPFRHYYGSIDATPLFVMLAGAWFERTRDLTTLERLGPHIEAALDWIDRYGDRDGDGFVEYHRQNPDGLANQGWKDSEDAVFHADGRLAIGPIALIEVQAYVYAAWRAAAAMLCALGQAGRARKLEQRAETLRKRFDEAFFDASLGTYVLALDGDKRPCRVRTSNAGHALYTGIAYPKRAEAVVRSLMARASFSGWGVRTLAASEARFNPMSYHNGSVWPHDNALIAAGMARYGYKGQAARIFAALFDASMYFDLRRMPELFCGFARQHRRGPTLYPVACMPQAWAAVAPLSLLASCLGLRFEPEASQVVFEEPLLPEFLDEVVLRRLAVGNCGASVRLRRVAGRVGLEVLARRGALRVLTVS